MKYPSLLMMTLWLSGLGSYAQTTFQKIAIDPANSNITGIYADDLNNDGLRDIAVCENANNRIVIWINDKEEPLRFSKYIVDDAFAHPLYIVIKDINKDGKNDILASSSQENSVAWWKNEGGNPIQWTKQVITTDLPGAHAVDVADFNQDGFNDVMATSSGSTQLVFYESNGANPVTWTKQVVDNNFPNSQTAMAVDIDKDGLMDIVAGSSSGDAVAWWRNRGGQRIEWEKINIANSASGVDFPHWIQAVDMDGDGDLDVLVSMYMTGEIAWWENENNGSEWVKNPVVGDFLAVLSVQATDLDNDSMVDIIGTSTYSRDIIWWKNIGNSASWTANLIEGNYKGAWPLFACDIDNDGDNDLITGADVPTGNSPLTLWKNTLLTLAVNEWGKSDMRTDLAVYPDPFSTTTQIDFSTEKPGLVKLGVYNLQGILIKELIHERIVPGIHTLPFDGTLLGNGTLVFRLETGGKVISRQAVLAR